MVSFLRTQHSVSEHPNVTTCCISQLNFSLYRNQPIRADFCRGQITSEAGLLPLRGFDQRHHLTRDWAACLADPRRQDRVEPGSIKGNVKRKHFSRGAGDAGSGDKVDFW
jgi:hypothetical protein